MKFACANCGQRLEAETAWAGRQINCPTCSHSITIAEEAVATVPLATPVVAKRRGGRIAIYSGAAAVALVALAFAGRWFFTPRVGASSNSPAASLFSFFDRADLAEVKVFPTEVHLGTKQDRQSVVVQATYADGATRDVTRDASFAVGNKSLVRLEGETLYPVADGQTELQIKFSGKSLAVPVTVESAKVERPISFRLDVIPALTKSGCNAGACHGSSRGKDGFRLSLFGYDPDGDYQRLTREQIGRRINLAIPEESLVIEKGLGAVPHTGGERFKKGDEIYNTLLRWLQAGAPKDATNVAKVASIEIMPKQAVLEGQGAAQKFTVRAKYSDGTDRDVTSLAVFISNNEPAAKVADGGLVIAGQRGESFVMARFDTFSVGSQVIVVPKNSPYKFPDDVAEYNYIDTLVHAKLKKLRS
jgi:DNA-directed RNA polymerase subunit RPC12/RpoP